MPREASGPHAFPRPQQHGSSAFRRATHGPLWVPALPPKSAPDAAASTASHPANPDDRDTPLSVGRDAVDYNQVRESVKRGRKKSRLRLSLRVLNGLAKNDQQRLIELPGRVEVNPADYAPDSIAAKR